MEPPARRRLPRRPRSSPRAAAPARPHPSPARRAARRAHDPAPVALSHHRPRHVPHPRPGEGRSPFAPGEVAAPATVSDRWPARSQPCSPTATSHSSSSGSPRRAPWLRPGGWAAGDKNGADGAAVEAMRLVLSTVPMDGIVVIGEGEKDEAPMLYNGERIGDGTPPPDRHRRRPVEGTTLTSLGRGNALSVIAVSERGTMFNPGPCVYMEKIAVGPECVGAVDITGPPPTTCTGRQGQGRVGPRRHRGDPRSRPPPRPHRRSARRRRPHPPDPGRRCDRRARRRRSPTPAPTSCSA